MRHPPLHLFFRMKTLYWDAINPFTGLPFTWDDLNIRWSDPSYYLEPGDPGFVPYDSPSPIPTKTKKTKHMKRQNYYPSRVAEQLLWLENFRNKITGYQATLGLTAGQIAAAIADARWLIYVLGSWLPAVRAFAPACTQTAEDAQTGTGAAALALTTFTPPVLPSTPAPAVVPVAPGALDRIFALVALIKDAAGYTGPIGEDLNLAGSEKGGPDLVTLQPILTAEIIGNNVHLGWNWQGYGAFLDMLEIQVDRGSGWVHLASDTTPNYIDTMPFPANFTGWKYRAIFHIGDAAVGIWSAVVSVGVAG